MQKLQHLGPSLQRSPPTKRINKRVHRRDSKIATKPPVGQVCKVRKAIPRSVRPVDHGGASDAVKQRGEDVARDQQPSTAEHSGRENARCLEAIRRIEGGAHAEELHRGSGGRILLPV